MLPCTAYFHLMLDFISVVARRLGSGLFKVVKTEEQYLT